MVNWVLGSDSGNPINYVAYSSILHRRSRARQWWLKKRMTHRHTGGEDPFERTPGTPIAVVEKMGEGDGSQQLRIPMLMPLTRGMRSDDSNAAYTRGVGDMVDNEERPGTRNAVVWTNNMQHSTATYNLRLTDLRLAFKMSLKFNDLLSEWHANAKEELYWDAVYEGYGVHITGDSLASVSNHKNQLAADGAQNLAACFGEPFRLNCEYLRALASWIGTTSYINPLNTDSGNEYALILHEYCYADLFREEEFRQAMQQARARGKDNPMFQFEDNFYAGFHIYICSRVRTVDSTYEGYKRMRMNVLLGADALFEAQVGRPQFVERNENKYGSIAGFGIVDINGQARADWRDAASAVDFNQSSAIVYGYTSETGNISVLPAV